MASKKWKASNTQHLKVKASSRLLFLGLLISCISCKSQSNFEKKEAITKSANENPIIGTPVLAIATNITVVFQDKQNNYWFGSKEEGVFKYDTQPKEATRQEKLLTQFTITDGLCANSILGIQEDNFGNIYFDTPDGVSKFDGQKFIILEVVTNNYFKNKCQQ